MVTNVFLFLSVIVFVYGEHEQKGRFNILFLQSDEMDGRVLDPTSLYWNIVSMPNLRNLAEEGINFINAYSNSPLCVPSRSSMHTGRFVNNIQTWSNEKGICTQIENPNKADESCANVVGYGEQVCINLGKIQNVTTTIKQSMISAGYNVQFYGKMDIGGGISITNTTDVSGFHCEYNGNWSNLINSSCNLNSTKSYCPGGIVHSWSRQANVTHPTYIAPDQGNWIRINSTISSNGKHDQNVTTNCLNWIDTYAKSDQTKPFLLYCSLINPHPPYWSNSTWFKYLNYTALNISYNQMMDNFNDIDSFDIMHPADKYSSILKNIGTINYTDNTKWSYNLYKSYFASCATLDYMMGRIINKLKTYSDLYKNTVIVYTSDHGELHLEHRQVEKTAMYEGSSRVPLIVSGPDIPSNVIIKNNLTSLVDIFPTFLDASNISYQNKIYPKNLNGYSLSTFFNWKWINTDNNPYLNRPNYVFSKLHSGAVNTGQYMLRQNKYKLILYATNYIYSNYTPQLFDIENDKNEIKNIANQNKEIVKNMTDIINNILIQSGGGDYNFIDTVAQNEGKQNFLRWQTAIDNAQQNNNLWINYTNATFMELNDDDVNEITVWLDNTSK